MEPAELRRNKEQGAYDLPSVVSVFADSFLAHVAYVDDDLPQCLPMIALLKEFDGETSVWLHGHPSSRLMELVKQRDRQREKSPEIAPFRVCITATKVDGLVLSSAPNGHSFEYRSGVIHGACMLESDRGIKHEIMKGVTNHIVTNRWDDVNPVASFQISLVCVIKVKILKLSFKSRTGVPGIQPRSIEKDGPDHEVPVWTGVVPLHDVLDVPVPSGLTPNAAVPSSLFKFIDERNRKHKDYAISVAK